MQSFEFAQLVMSKQKMGQLHCYILNKFRKLTAFHRQVLTSGWTTYYSLGCQPVDYSTGKLAMRMLNFVWWTWILKAVELVETAIFILRKKYNQVSKLHVYHHSSTFLLGWVGVKYVGGMKYYKRIVYIAKIKTN